MEKLENDLTPEKIKANIEAFKTLKLQPYLKGQNSLEYFNYFNAQYLKCFKDGLVPVLHQESVLSNYFFRVRELNSIKNIDSVQEYSYPPSKNDFEHGLKRANLPGFPVFYCAHHLSTSLNEIKKWSKESLYAVAKWKIKNIQHQFLHVPTYPEKPEFNELLQITINKWIKGSNTHKEALIAYINFLGDQLMQEDYTFSSCISHKLFYNENIDILSYPSCLDWKGINFAISPRIIDNGILILDRVYIGMSLPNNQFKFLKIGVFLDNSSPTWYNGTINELPLDIRKTLFEDFQPEK